MLKKRFFIIYLLLGIGIVYLTLHEDIAVPMNTPFSQFPVEHGEWRMAGQTHFSDGVLEQLRPADYLSRRYRNADGRMVDLYIGYHSGGKDSGPIHSPKHCLPGGGWFLLDQETIAMETPTGPIQMVRAVYGFGESRELFLYWFQVRDRSLTNEYVLKLAEIQNSMFHRRRDSSFIRISVPADQGPEQAMETATRFVRDFHPVILEFLPT